MTLHVSSLRFEHHRVALGIGETAPRLSWIVDAAPSGWRQEGYELECRDEAGAVESRAVVSEDSRLVPWPFAPLAARARRALRVRVTGGGVRSGWSEWVPVEAGLLDVADWQAQMVGPAAPQAPAPRLRARFTVANRPIAAARLYATAQGVFQAELNGNRAGDEEFAPGWTAYADRLLYSTYDVTALLRPGENAIGIWLGDGWWRGRLGWDNKRAIYGTQLGALAQLEITYADGTRQIVASGADWRAGPGPILGADFYDGETFDARLHDPAWSQPGFDETGWAPVEILPFDHAILAAPLAAPVRHVETRAVQQVLTSPSGGLILDFGQNLVGRLRLVVRGPADTRIVLRHAEVLEKGELALAPLRSAKAMDEYILSGEGTESWAPRFTFHGFRYASIEGWPGAFEPSSVVAEVLHTDMERTGTFNCSHALLNRLHENIVWSMRGNFVGLPTDCPQRDERLGWTGDLQVFAPAASFLYDCAGLLSSWLLDLAAEQTRLGGVPMLVPAVTTGAEAPMAGWADAATIVPWILYQRFGDLEILRRQFPSMAGWVEQQAGLAGEDRLWTGGFQFGDWLDPQAPANRPDAARTYPEIVATAYFVHSAQIVADTAELLGRAEDAARFGRLAAEARAAFQAEYVSSAGRLLSDSATAYALALCFNLLETDAQRRHAGDRLAELVRGNGCKVPTGFIGTPLICAALSGNGHLGLAYQLLLQTEPPSWLYEVQQGATTIWERWDSLLPDGSVNPSGMTSFNHYAFGAVADWMHGTIAGLAPAAPGWRRLRAAPRPPRRGLTQASASLHTPYGAAHAGWTLEEGQFTFSLVVPVGVSADVSLPSGALFEGLEHGEYAWKEPFETEAEGPRSVTVDTRLDELVLLPEAMSVLQGVIVKYVPEAAEHMSAGLQGRGEITPRQIAAMLPHAEAVLADLERGFAALSAGLPIPEDVLAAPPAAEDDGLDELATLLSGRDFWSTHEARGLRSLVLTDGPHGVRRQKGTSDHLGIHQSLPATCFPTGTALACAWDPALIAEVAAALGHEARALGVDVLLGPAINIKRSPLGGRNFEYLSEDPLLAGQLASAYVRALQATGVGASVKHFAVNNQETDRMGVSAEVGMRALREIYLPAFERVVKEAAPATVMSAYNAINGAFCSENRWLLTELLRDEWGFDGVVVSDWGAIKDRVEALRAGLDLDMPGGEPGNARALVEAVRAGKLPRPLLEQSFARLARLAERTAPDSAAQEEKAGFDAAAHHALARRAAAQSVVLLRNEHATLPLRQGQKIAVLGGFAAEPQIQGGGSSHVNPTRIDAPLTMLREALGEEQVSYAPGYGGADDDAAALLAQAVAAARAADVAVLFVGLYEAEQSEGFDREHLRLPAAHLALIEAVAGCAPRTVVVLSNGGVVSLEPWHDRVDAILEGWALGQAIGGALADVLTGAVNPSGRLAETIPLVLEDTPCFINFPGENNKVLYGEGIFVGYRYYVSANRPVRYPFGHGLSYSTFAYEALTVEATGPDTARATCTLRNIGARAGAHVVQLYVAPAAAEVRRPARTLAAFGKVTLAPGEAATLSFELDRSAFAYWDEPGARWHVPGGTYGIELGHSVTDITHTAPLTLEGDKDRPMPLTLESTVKAWFGHRLVGPLLQAQLMSNLTEEQRQAAGDNSAALKMVESMPMAQFIRFPGVEVPAEALEEMMALSRGAAA